MQHTMKLHPSPFERIITGQKTFELRLYDEKRQRIQVGDTILFTKTTPPYETVLTRVMSVEVFPDFAALYATLPLTECGYTQEELPTASPQDMTAYYSLEQQQQYGVVGIRIAVLADGDRSTL